MFKTEKYNSFFNKFIYIFLFFSPILDALTSIFKKNIDFPISLGTIFRGIFLLFILIWLKNNYKNKKILLLFALYLLLAMMYYFNKYKAGIVTEASNILHIFYLPILMLFFSNYNNKKINDKLILKIYLLYLNLIIIPYIFGIGFNLTESYSNKLGYFGLFSFGNEISAVLVVLGVIALNYVNKSNSYILKIFTYLELFICIYLVGTKTLFLGTIITLMYFLIKFIKFSMVFEVKKDKKVLSIFLVILVISFVIFLPKTPMIKNIKTTLDYYKIDSVKDIVNIKNIDNVIFSKRLDNLNKVNKEYVKGDVETIIYGIGETGILKINSIEIDIFDIFYSIGIIGGFIYILLVLYTIKFKDLRDLYRFDSILLILISIITGHILIQLIVSIYLEVLYLLIKN